MRNKNDANNLKLKIDNSGKLVIVEDEEEEETEENWTLPEENTTGHILSSSGEILSIDNSTKPDDQMWVRSQSNNDGYFILKHLKTGRCLTIDEYKTLNTG